MHLGDEVGRTLLVVAGLVGGDVDDVTFLDVDRVAFLLEDCFIGGHVDRLIDDFTLCVAAMTASVVTSVAVVIVDNFVVTMDDSVIIIAIIIVLSFVDHVYIDVMVSFTIVIIGRAKLGRKEKDE